MMILAKIQSELSGYSNNFNTITISGCDGCSGGCSGSCSGECHGSCSGDCAGGCTWVKGISEETK